MREAFDLTPIEDRLWRALRMKLDLYPHRGFCGGHDLIRIHDFLWREGRPAIVAGPQVTWDTYVLDFMMIMMGIRAPVCLAIECDGHKFHERTKEQAARDRSRDRTLMKHGFRVVRFTGSEIWHRANECAQEICDILGDDLAYHLDELRSEGRL